MTLQSRALERARAFGQFFRGIKNDYDTQSKKEFFKGIGQKVLMPGFIPERFYEVSKSAQWLAAALLSVVIPTMLALVYALDQVFQEFLLNNGTSLGNQTGLFSFVSTGLGIAFFIIGVWGCFVWVRTGGLRIFAGI